MSKKYEFTREMGEISGFGGDYEEVCRKMLLAGVKWINKNPNLKLEFTEYQNVFGIINSKNENAKNLEKAILKAVKGDCTGAMLHAVISHLIYIKKNGWENYVKEMIKREMS